MKTTDGCGDPIDVTALYYIQDTRQVVGNCGLWWCPNGAGYTCTLADAGQYTGKDGLTMRDTDVLWPVAYVEARMVTHVRVDNQAFERKDPEAKLGRRKGRR